MKNFKLLFIALIVIVSSCADNNKKNEAANTDSVTTMKMASDSNVITSAVDSTTAPKAINWAGTYKTSYPEGYNSTAIMLHNDNTYMYTAKYYGDKAKTVKLSGKFNWTGAGSIRLDNAKDEPADYILKENELIQVNKDAASEVVITLTKEK